MRTIYCLIEQESQELNELIKKYDNDESMIHVYTQIIDFYDGNIIQCIADLFYCISGVGQSLVITDIKNLYDILLNYFSDLFDDIILVNESDKKAFIHDFSKECFIEMLKKNQSDNLEDRMIKLFIRLRRVNDILVYNNFSNAISEVRNDISDTVIKKICCIAKMFVDMMYDNKIKVTNEFRIFILSLIMQVDKSEENTKMFLDNLLSCDYFCHEDYYFFVLNQMKMNILRKKVIIDNYSQKLLEILHEKIYEMSYERIKDRLKKIPEEERNKDSIIVYTTQYISLKHEPTKAVRNLLKQLIESGKKVYLVNTCEHNKAHGYVPMYNTVFGSINDNLRETKNIDIDGNDVEYTQLSEKNGIVKLMELLVYEIEKIKPEYILAMDKESMLAELSANIVPVEYEL